jgi:hypothetical protein
VPRLATMAHIRGTKSCEPGATSGARYVGRFHRTTFSTPRATPKLKSHPSSLKAQSLRGTECSSPEALGFIKMAYVVAMSVGASTAGVTQFAVHQIADSERPTNDRIRNELASLLKQLRDVEQQIRIVKDTLHGLSIVFGDDVVSAELLDVIRGKRRTNNRGLTDACKSVLLRVGKPCSVSTVCKLVTEINPTLLMHHRNPRASAMSALRNLARRSVVIRRMENGKSVWEVNWDRVSSTAA